MAVCKKVNDRQFLFIYRQKSEKGVEDVFRCKPSEQSRESLLKGNQFILSLKIMFDDLRKKYDLKKVEMQILWCVYISEENVNTPSDIGRILAMNKAMVSKGLDSLYKRNMVTYLVDDKDRRYVHYTIGENGKAVCEDFEHLWDYMREKLFKGIPKEDVDKFLEVAKKMHMNLLELDEKEQ